MEERIQESLNEIEQTHAVRVLYACESGNRAWGFASRDSDYDVRFLFAHPPDWYLSTDLESRRNVIEKPIENELDVSGWDLRKATRNRCAHPTLCKPTLNSALGHFDDMIQQARPFT